MRFSTVSLTYARRRTNSTHARLASGRTIKSEKRGAFYFSPGIVCCPYAELRESFEKIPFTGNVPREQNREPRWAHICRACMRPDIRLGVSLYLYIHARVSVYIYLYISTYICNTYIFMRVYMCAYIHTVYLKRQEDEGG